MHIVKENDLGIITVEEGVVETLAGMAALDSYGLVGMVARNLQSGLSSVLGIDSIRKGVMVKEGTDGLEVEVSVIIGYGIPIAEVCHNVMQKVAHELENNAGIPVAQVNVNVMGIKVLKDR